MGRHTSYTREIADAVLERLAATGSLARALSETPGAPTRNTIYLWIEQDVDGFSARYARAKEQGIDEFMDDTLTISDEAPPMLATGGLDHGAIAHAKLRIETRRWLAERMAPKKYGLKQGLELTGKDGGAMQTQIIIATGVPTNADDHSDLA